MAHHSAFAIHWISARSLQVLFCRGAVAERFPARITYTHERSLEQPPARPTPAVKHITEPIQSQASPAPPAGSAAVRATARDNRGEVTAADFAVATKGEEPLGVRISAAGDVVDVAGG